MCCISRSTDETIKPSQSCLFAIRSCLLLIANVSKLFSSIALHIQDGLSHDAQLSVRTRHKMGSFDEQFKIAATPGPGRTIAGAVLLATDKSGI